MKTLMKQTTVLEEAERDAERMSYMFTESDKEREAQNKRLSNRSSNGVVCIGSRYVDDIIKA